MIGLNRKMRSKVIDIAEYVEQSLQEEGCILKKQSESSESSTSLSNQRKILIDYLLMKVVVEDFHAVADAAMDLRELDAKMYIKVLK